MSSPNCPTLGYKTSALVAYIIVNDPTLRHNTHYITRPRNLAGLAKHSCFQWSRTSLRYWKFVAVTLKVSKYYNTATAIVVENGLQ